MVVVHRAVRQVARSFSPGSRLAQTDQPGPGAVLYTSEYLTIYVNCMLSKKFNEKVETVALGIVELTERLFVKLPQ